jgi:hypothetical protein
MRKFVAGAFAAALLVATCVIPAMAAGPDHQTIRGTDVDPDFCGTGQIVNVAFTGVFNGWEDKAFGHIQNTWTNPANGIAIYDTFSGGGKLSVTDDGNGAYTIALAREGQPVHLQYVGGPLIVQDVGLVIVYDHFDADDNYLGTDVVIVGGPHPALEEPLDWCDLMVDLLQL